MPLVKQACLPLRASILAAKCSLVRVPDELTDLCAAWSGVENARPGLGAVHRMGHEHVGLREVDVELVVAEPPGWVAELPFELLTAEVDVRDAELAHLLRRGGYLLADIAPVLTQVREAGRPGSLAESLAAWRQRFMSRSHAMLIAAGNFADYLQLLTAAPSNNEPER